LLTRQAAVVGVYDADAATYDEHPYPAAVQEEWVARTLRLVPAGGAVLDAPCGTGRYFAAIAAAGLGVAGIDQSAGMLDRARRRGIASSLEKVSLQDLTYDGQFDADGCDGERPA
jgi:SAM-dependent methyltransferase